MIIGITGTDGSGKGVVADYLVHEKGFIHCSARAIFEDEFVKRGMESNRENMRMVANDLRATYGNDFVVSYYLEKMVSEKATDFVIESIRATAEADTLKAAGGILLATDADQRRRYERIHARKSSSDQVSFEEFVAHEALEMNDPDPNGMQKAKVMEMADYTFVNDSGLEELHTQIEDFLRKNGR